MRKSILSALFFTLFLTLEAKELILVQGAMDMEVSVLTKALKESKEETIGSWTFWKGSIGGNEIIVSRTEIGLVNASAATAIAIEKYKPTIIINQGTSGGYPKDLHLGDIVIGKKIFNYGAVKSESRAANAGVNTSSWKLFPVVQALRENGKIVEHDYFESDSKLMEIAGKVKYEHGKVEQGTIGSADQWNCELDRISYLNKTYGMAAEEMEAVASAQVAKAFDIPFLSVRVLSDSEINKEEFDPRSADWCQEFVLEIIKSIK